MSKTQPAFNNVDRQKLAERDDHIGDFFRRIHRYCPVPHHADAVVMFTICGVEPTSGFFRPLFQNNLKESFGGADHINQHLMLEWVRFLVNHTPGGWFNDKDSFKRWVETAGLLGELEPSEWLLEHD